MKIALVGYGKMGKAVEEVALLSGATIGAIFTRSLDKASLLKDVDVCIDFSHASNVLPTLKACTQNSCPLIIGTTGWEKELPLAKQLIKEANGAALYAPNFSLGMCFFSKLIQQAATLSDRFPTLTPSGTETHHVHKKDAPSGTAKHLASHFHPPLSFASKREGEVVGTHTITFSSPYETITLTHDAKTRKTFAEGALRAATWIVGKTGWFTLEDLINTP